uniref:G/T mismatch-specific thymine DNA glycosylase n=1 Tax=Pavo cristatus TaxID=9049 RepID=A0A8C9F1W6_PAVCR
AGECEYYAYLQQAQAFYTFPFHQMMTAPPTMEAMTEQPTLEGVPEPNLAQEPPKGGRKRKAKATEPKQPKKPAAKKEKATKSKGKQEKITDTFKVKRKVDRFNGVSEAELLTKTLPDILTFDLDIVIIGINPGLMAAYKGHHYPGPGNHFWKCLFMSGLSNEQLNHMDDHTLPHKYGIGFTNMVERTTPGSKDLSSKEFREGGRILMQKLQKYKPRIAAFNGKCIYEIFSREVFGIRVKNLEFGLQPHKVPETETVSTETCPDTSVSLSHLKLICSLKLNWVLKVQQFDEECTNHRHLQLEGARLSRASGAGGYPRDQLCIITDRFV